MSTALLGEAPEIFAVSARQALEARDQGQGDGTGGQADRASEELWKRSGFGAVEDYLLNTLDQQERVRLKLLNPLNVGLRLASKYKDAAFERLKLLTHDVEAIQNIDQQLALFHQEMLRDFEPRLARLDVLLGDMERRGMRFFEETIRIGRIKSLMDSEGVNRTFEREVIGETPRQIEDEVSRVIDWIVERNLKLWQDISGYIERRQLTRHREGMIGDVGSSFNYNRQALLDSIGRLSARWSGATTGRKSRGRSPTRSRVPSPHGAGPGRCHRTGHPGRDVGQQRRRRRHRHPPGHRPGRLGGST